MAKRLKHEDDQPVILTAVEEKEACFRACVTSGFLRAATRIACESLPDDTSKLEELARACEDSCTCRLIVKRELRSWRFNSIKREPWLFRLTMRRISKRGPEAHELLQRYPKTFQLHLHDLSACSFREEVRDCGEFRAHEQNEEDPYEAQRWMFSSGRRHVLRNLVGYQPPDVIAWYLRNMYPDWRHISVESTGTKNFLHAMFECRSAKWVVGVVREMLRLPGDAKLRESDFSVWTTARRVPKDRGYAQRVLVKGADDLVECDTEEGMEKRIRWAAHGNCYEEHVWETLRGAPRPEDYSVRPDATRCKALANWRHARSVVKEHYRAKRLARVMAWRKISRGDRAIRVPF